MTEAGAEVTAAASTTRAAGADTGDGGPGLRHYPGCAWFCGIHGSFETLYCGCLRPDVKRSGGRCRVCDHPVEPATLSACANCGSPEGRHLSYDMDLPTVCLCAVCSMLLATNLALFDEIRERHQRAVRRAARDARPDPA